MNRTPTALIVEDDDTLADLLAGLLARAGHTCARAVDRDGALSLLRQHDGIALVLLDLGLPPYPNEIREGITLLERLIAERPHLKVLVLTGQDQDAAAFAAIRAGAFDFLAKPAQAAQILAAARRATLFLAHERALREAGESRITIAARLDEGLKEAGEAAEERLLRQVLADTGFNVAETARRLGLPRENLYYFLKKYGIQRNA